MHSQLIMDAGTLRGGSRSALIVPVIDRKMLAIAAVTCRFLSPRE